MNNKIKSKAEIRAEKLLPGNQDFTTLTDEYSWSTRTKKDSNSMVAFVWTSPVFISYFCW